MNYRECHLFSSRFVLLFCAVCGLLFFAAACGSSKEAFLTRGEEYLQKRKFHEAVMQFRSAADIDKDSAEAHWGLARAYENLGQFNETVDELRKTVDNAPNNLDARAKLGNYSLLFTPPLISEAEKHLQEIFSRNADHIEGHILKASILTIQKKTEAEILGVLDHAINLDPARIESYLSKSRYYTTLGKTADAENTIKKAIEVNPNAALGYLEYGRFLGFADRAAEAEAQLKKAIEVEPQNIEAREETADFYLAQRQFEKAEHALLELVRIQENSPESRLSLANFYVRIGREDEALTTLNQILTDAPEYVRARYRLGKIMLDRREYAEVRKQVEILLSINDRDTEALMLRAQADLQENKTEDAVKDLEEILKKQPNQKDALFYMTQARLALGQNDQALAFIGDLEKYHPAFLKTKLLKIQLSFATGKAENALRLSNELIDQAKKTFPNEETDAQGLMELQVRALSSRGLAFLELGKIAEAKTDLQEIVKLSPSSSAALVNYAKIPLAENNLAEALSYYERALTADNKNFDALSGAVSVLVKQKQPAQAHGKIDKAIQENAGKNTTVAALQYLKSTVFTAEGNQTAAEDTLKQSMTSDENYLPAYSAYASILASRNETDEAVGQYRKIIDKKPSASVHTLLGMLEESRGNAAEAEKNYRRALEIMPDAPIAANNLAWLITETGGNLDEALTLSQKSVKQIQAAGFYDTLGWVYFKKGLYSPAIEQMKKAVALDETDAKKNGRPANASYRLRLGTALASTGDKMSARREVESSLQNASSLSSKEAQDAKNLLATL